jgi:trk system potassium uptake protein TrkA
MKQYVIIGAGKFGASVAVTLSQKGYNVLLIDNGIEKIQELSDIVTKAIQLDATDEKAMNALGLKEFDVAIVAIGRQSIEDSVLVTMMLKELGIGTVIAKATTEAHGRILTRVGADRVVFPERDMGIRLANSLTTSSIMDHLGVVPGYSVAEIQPSKEIMGKTIKESDIKAKYGIQIIAVKTLQPNIDENGESVVEEQINIVPDAATKIEKDNILLVLGKDEDIEKIKRGA